MTAQFDKLTFKDLAAKHGIEIDIRSDGLVVWVNVDGICVTRILTNGLIDIKIDDRRNKPVDHPHLVEN